MASLPRKLLLLNMFAHQSSHVASIMAPGEAQARPIPSAFLQNRNILREWAQEPAPLNKKKYLLQSVYTTTNCIQICFPHQVHLPYFPFTLLKKKKKWSILGSFSRNSRKGLMFPMWIRLKIKKTDYHAFVISAQKTAKNVPLHFQAVEKHNQVENGSNNFQRNS